jgi:DNA repair protein RecO (recombination protein O)
MLHKTSGIILHTTKYSDTSLIVKIYTASFGLQSYMVNGVRGKKSKNKASLFQPMSLVELVVSNSEKGTLQRISEMNVLHPYTEIPYNIIKSSIAIFLNEVLYKTLKEQQPDEDLFEYVQNSLRILDLKTDNCATFHIFFLLQLSRFLGFYPQGNYTTNTPFFDLMDGRFVSSPPSHSNYLETQNSLFLDTFLRSNYENLHRIVIDKSHRKSFLQYMVLYYQFHISTFGSIKSIDVLEEVIG